MNKKIDTTETRKAIGFPKRREDWNKEAAFFDKHTLKIDGHPVMEDWETGYMKSLSDIAAQNGGKILELGYGMGISAAFIQEHSSVKDHYIVECHPDVLTRALKDMRDQIENSKVHLISGFWQDITPQLADGSFDGILFDTYPLTEKEIHSNHFWFFEEAHRLLKKGGVLTYYSDEATKFSPNHLHKLQYAGFHEINLDIVDVNPPDDCEYWQDKTIVAPIIIK